MSIYSVKLYQLEVEKIIHFGGTKKETAIRTAFQALLNEYAKQKGLMLITEISIKGSKGKIVTPDGTLKDSLRQDWGYWESKDEADNIDEEISKKFAKGYPKDNILFEDSNTAILIQEGNEVMRIAMSDTEALDRIIHEFISYERPEVENFHKAIELFKQDIPKVTDTLRGIILSQEKTNAKFIEAEANYWALCKESINPGISLDDIREMMIQHILTEDIFNTIFGETQFHRENNIARELEQVILTFFTGATKHKALNSIQHYYNAINAAAAQIADHHEKQKFLKVIYEVFYKGYNPKAADRLGVVYTPNEIVKFMIESTDYLLQHHFGKGLEDKGVEILDPATGTGTFICDIIDYIPKSKLPYKYEHEIHANEIAILPYYIANLNIEYTYKQKTGEYKEFESLCFVDTLDNLGFSYAGKQTSIFGANAENTARIKRQNNKKISVVIGNPPYNANQMNENENNKNREYYLNYSKKTGGIDGRIKDTFIKYSTAQKTKVYDMYARFYRWALDRLDENGIVAFITNRSFIESRTFDGFRKVMASEFNRIYIVDLGGDVRVNPKLSGTKHNVFGIQTGVAIAFMVRMNNIIEAHSPKQLKQLKREYDVMEEPVIRYNAKEYLSTQGCNINYYRRPEFETAFEKLNFLGQTKFIDINFEKITPDKNNNWINLSNNNDWEEMIPIFQKDQTNSLFSEFFNGISTNRDEWVYDFDQVRLRNKLRYFIQRYNSLIQSNDFSYPSDIKWSETLKINFKNKKLLEISHGKFQNVFYRPFIKSWFYSEKLLSDRLTDKQFKFYGQELEFHSKSISINQNDKGFCCIAHTMACDLHLLGDTKTIPLCSIEYPLKRIDNITDWGLQQFQDNYTDQTMTKENIFHYVYAVLHNPAYRTKYELNLKRDFPRIPFYEDFGKWVAWGKQLMDLHINYETIEPFDLKEITAKDAENPKAKLKADKESGIIILDEATTLTGIPTDAWQYKLGNRSALEWVLDQYKEKKPTDPTIAEKFNTYRFADYKTQVINLLRGVCTVSVETMSIITEMNNKQ
ncbi:MAG: N-6 DNA methylase [Bacteroidia bacterium]|nr:N-6 DNA methylase [Bacteroidia bacterium]